MSEAASLLKEIFSRALEFDSPKERDRYLTEACGGNAALRAEVETLVGALGKAGDFLETPASVVEEAKGRSISFPSHAVGHGTAIGPYTLIEEIGEGGFGVVYLAEQTQPVRRKVALKILKPGMDTRQVVSRFEAERQALALMDHPNIAKVLDAGTTGTTGEPEAHLERSGTSGSPPLLPFARGSERPYFVMELVQGATVTEFCDQRLLTPRQRLELFIPVCLAVQHAHQKGIIHRDLKPSNVLVALHDDKPVPKVIDFGIAKALGQELTDKTVFTGNSQMIGTPPYMSPEQAGQGSLDIDTRSDIYSLGVLLYELLTGATPFGKERLNHAGYDEVRRIIREEEPPKPSARLSERKLRHASCEESVARSVTSTLASIAAQRHTEPAKLVGLLRGELDWIVMKALEKDRERRYQTANALALDVQRYLANEPVEASPPSTVYRLKKFVSRNRAPVLAASIILLLLIGGILGTTVGLVKAEEARQSEKTRAEAERQAKELAEKRLLQVEKGINILGAIFVDLDPRAEEKQGRPLRAILGDRLNQAVAELEGETLGDPIWVARLQNRLGLSLLGLGDAGRAITLFARARDTQRSLLGPEDPDTLSSMHNLALAYMEDGKLDKALPLFEETLRLRRAVLAHDAPPTLNSMASLAVAYRRARRFREAISLHEDALEIRKTRLGADHPDTLTGMNNLAMAYQEAGQVDRALKLLEETLNLTQAQRGTGHHDTLRTTNNLALAYAAAKRPHDALPLCEKNLALARANLGSDHPQTLLCAHNLAAAYQAGGRADEALPLFKEAAEGVERRQFRHEHADQIVHSLIACHERSKHFTDAEVWRRKWLAASRDRTGADSLPYAGELAALGFNLLHQKKWIEAEAMLRDSLAIRAKKEPDSWTPFQTKSLLGAALLGQAKYDEAEPLLLEGYEGLKQREAKIPPQAKHLRLREAVERLVELYDARGMQDRADEWRKTLKLIR